MLRGDLRVLSIAGQMIEAVQHLPARRQGRIYVDGEEKALDGARRVLESDVAKTPFLMEPAEPGLGVFQPGEHFERIRNALHVPLARRGDQKKVTIFRRVGQDGLGALQRLRMTPFLLKSPKRGDVLFHL